MSDELNKQEQGLQDILRKAEFTPNMEGLWEHVDNQLREERPKRRALLWWCIGIVLLGLSSIGLNFMLDDKQGSLTSNSEVVAATDSQVVESQKNVMIEKLASPVVENKIASKTGLTKKYGEGEESTFENSQIKSATELTTLELRTGNSESLGSAKISGNTIGNTIQKNVLQKEPTNISVAAKAQTMTAEIVEPSESVGTLPSPIKSTEFTNVEGIKIASLFPLPTIESTGPLYALKNRDDYNLSLISPIRSASGRYFIRLRGGASKSFTAISDIAPSAEFDAKAFDREQGVVGLDMGLDIGKYFGKWRVLAGVGVHNSTTQYWYNETETTSGQGQGTAFIYIADDGSSTSAQGEIEVTTSTNYDLQWHRRHQLVDAHIGVGRELLSVGILSFGVDALAGFNISSSHTGYQFAQGQEVLQKITSEQENIYRKNMGLSAAIAGHASLQLQQVAISLVPVWRHQFSSFTNTDNFYQIKNSQLGLQLGITYKPRWK